MRDETSETRAGETPVKAPRGKAAREAKLAIALRANLLRRKLAARAADLKDEG